MGYTTDFMGSFELNKPLSKKMNSFLTDLARTRRMKRKMEGFGVEGEFFIGEGDFGMDEDGTVVDGNSPPSSQPGLWMQWIPNEAGTHIEWDGNEKFYYYTEWLVYLIEKILKPNGYVLNGQVEYQGEEMGDRGFIIVTDNDVDGGDEPIRAINMQTDITYKTEEDESLTQVEILKIKVQDLEDENERLMSKLTKIQTIVVSALRKLN